ncbi:hypothetical protein BGZ63DRAFT_353731 [Mariannaea sp. PMI_226]|nr:hypothetical protein BGZ63DRAFT_353731 [Mariannaea sp. PMI_226]
MLEYFKSKKPKKKQGDKEPEHQVENTENAARIPDVKAVIDDKHGDHDTDSSSASGHTHATPVLDRNDEAWLKSILDTDGPPPPLPPRVKTPQLELSDSDSADTGKDEEQHHHRLTLLFSRNKKHGDTLKVEDAAITPQEAEREKEELGSILDRLNLKAKNNKIVSMSNDSSDLLQSFTQVFKDLVNGGPTAYKDLMNLFDDRDGALNKGFEKLPSSLQKLVTQLPEKLTASLAPELLAAAAESQGLKAETSKGVKDATLKLLTPQNLTELVTKPGAMVSMLRAIVNALKLRWPAVMGTNVLWSRGREVRLEKERSDAEAGINDGDRIEELPDDPLLPAPEASSAATAEAATPPPASAHESPKPTAVELTDPVSPLDLSKRQTGLYVPADSSRP